MLVDDVGRFAATDDVFVAVTVERVVPVLAGRELDGLEVAMP